MVLMTNNKENIMKMSVNIRGKLLELDCRVITQLEDASIAWTCKPGEFFIKIISPEKYENQVWHSHVIIDTTTKIT